MSSSTEQMDSLDRGIENFLAKAGCMPNRITITSDVAEALFGTERKPLKNGLIGAYKGIQVFEKMENIIK